MLQETMQVSKCTLNVRWTAKVTLQYVLKINMFLRNLQALHIVQEHLLQAAWLQTMEETLFLLLTFQEMVFMIKGKVQILFLNVIL